MIPYEQLHSEFDELIQRDANNYMRGTTTLEEWRELWGHLNPVAYCTVPVSQMDMHKIHSTAGAKTLCQPEHDASLS